MKRNVICFLSRSLLLVLSLALLLSACNAEEQAETASAESLKLEDFYIFLVEDQVNDKRPVARITVNTGWSTEAQNSEMQELLDTGGRRALGEKILKDYLDEYLPARFDGICYPVTYWDALKDVKVTTHEKNWTKTVTLTRQFKLSALEFEHTVEMKTALPVVNDRFDTHTSSAGINDDLPYLDGRLTMYASGGGPGVSQDGTAYYFEGHYSFQDRVQTDFGAYEVEIYGAPSAFAGTVAE